MVKGNIYEQSDPTETAEYNDKEDVLDYCKTSKELILAMEVHTQVYICANKFGLEKLKQYAIHKFMLRLKSLERDRDEELTNDPFRLVYENTTMKDAHLRRTITKHCVYNFESITPEIKDLVIQHEPSA